MKMVAGVNEKPPIFYDDLRHLVLHTAEKFGSKELYIYLENGEKKAWSYNDLKNNIVSFGEALYLSGLNGKRIAVIGETHPVYTASYIAVVSAGGTIIPLDKELSREQIVLFLKRAEADAVLYTATFNDFFADDETFGFLTRMPIMPTEELANKEGYLPYPMLLEKGQAAVAEGARAFLDAPIDMDYCCTLLFTSGTTGTSKGVMLSHRNLISALNSSTHSMPCGPSCTFVSVLPIHHTYEMMCGQFGVIAIGGTMMINDSIKHALNNFATFKPNTLVLVPLFLETIHKRIFSELRRRGIEKKVRAMMKVSLGLLATGVDVRRKLFKQILDKFGGELRLIIVGGAHTDPQIIKDFYMLGITVLEGYGITGCAPLVAVNRSGKNQLGSVGLPVYGCEVKIDVTPGESTGEVLVKGPNVMLGYYKDPETTAEVMTEDGYFRTGDIGYLDKKGYLVLTGRKKNVIILSNGKNVFPEELEEYLGKIPAVLESVVVGREKEGGEVAITAIIVPNTESEELAGKTPSQIYDVMKVAVMNVNKHLPTFKHISDIEIRNEAFERNTSKKIIRYLVK